MHTPSKADSSISNFQLNNSVVKYLSPPKKRNKRHNQTTYINNASYNGIDRAGIMSDVYRNQGKSLETEDISKLKFK